MRVSMVRFFWLFLILLLAPLSAVSGQNTAPLPPQPRPTGPANVPPGSTDRQITLDVQVTDRSGAPVRGLQKQDFTLLDDKRPQNILSFSAVDGGAATATDPPVEIVLVVDAVNSSFLSNSYQRDEVRKFLLQNGGQLAWPVSFVIFSEAGVKVQSGSSRDGNALAASYDQYETGLRSKYLTNGGRWGATERIEISLNGLASIVAYEQTRPGRKLVIWLSRGWPMLSQTNPLQTSKDSQQLFDSIASVSTALRQARITLYSIDPGGLRNAGTIRNSYYENFLKGVASPSRALPGNLGLQVLAIQSGGRVFTSSNDLTSAIAHAVADADAFYVLSFDAARADQANEYHAFGITVGKPGITARTRTGYYAQR
ncbi:MAG: VWA domain-containing protein [Terriglobales bacterium]